MRLTVPIVAALTNEVKFLPLIIKVTKHEW